MLFITRATFYSLYANLGQWFKNFLVSGHCFYARNACAYDLWRPIGRPEKQATRFSAAEVFRTSENKPKKKRSLSLSTFATPSDMSLRARKHLLRTRPNSWASANCIRPPSLYSRDSAFAYNCVDSLREFSNTIWGVPDIGHSMGRKTHVYLDSKCLTHFCQREHLLPDSAKIHPVSLNRDSMAHEVLLLKHGGVQTT